MLKIYFYIKRLIIKMLNQFRIYINAPQDPSHTPQEDEQTGGSETPTSGTRKDATISMYTLDSNRMWNQEQGRYRDSFLDPYIVHEYSSTIGDKHQQDKEWFFSTFVLGDFRCNHANKQISFDGVGDSGTLTNDDVMFNSMPANKSAIENYFINSLNQGGINYDILNRLNTKISSYKQELGDPPFQHKFILTLPTIITRTYDNSGRLRNLFKQSDTKTLSIALKKYMEAGYADGGRWSINFNPIIWQLNNYLVNEGIFNNAQYANNNQSDEYLVNVVKQLMNGTIDISAYNHPIKANLTRGNGWVRTAYPEAIFNGATAQNPHYAMDLNYWGNGYDLRTNVDIIRALKWYVDEVIAKVNTFNFNNLVFEGFYMVCENPTYQYDVEVINAISEYIHSKNLKLNVSPYPSYYNEQATGKYSTLDGTWYPIQKMKQCNFDNVHYQINYALANNNESLESDINYIIYDNLNINIAINKNTFKSEALINRLNEILTATQDISSDRDLFCYDDDGAIFEIKNNFDGYLENAKVELDKYVYALIH